LCNYIFAYMFLFWILAGYQHDYVFDWTVARQAADNNRLRVCLLLFFFPGITTSASFTVLNVQHFFPLTTSWVGEVGWWDHQQTGLSGLQVCELHTHFGMLYLWNKQGGNWKPAGSLLLICFLTARQDVPGRFPGPVDAFGRRTGSGSGHYGEQTKHRSLLDTLLAPKTVRNYQSNSSWDWYLQMLFTSSHSFFCALTIIAVAVVTIMWWDVLYN